MKNREKILFLTTELPYPTDNGGKIRTFNMIKGMSNEYDIDLVCFSEFNHTDIETLSNLCSNIKVINKIFTNSKSKIKMVLSLIKCILKNNPFIVEKFINRQYSKSIKQFVKENTYKAIFFDHLNITNYYYGINNIECKKILSEHNCEYLILKRRYENEKNIFKKLYLKYEYKKTMKYEKSICKNFDNIIVLTQEDKRYICDNHYNNVSIIPISVDTEYIKKNNKFPIRNLLFLGTMSWYPNEHGILWFLKNVWPSILNEYNNIKLYIVGKNPSDEIKKYSGDNIIVTGYVDDVNKYIELCDVCVVPLFIGGGMRVKILECMSKGIPVISTSIGAEGIDYVNGKNIIIADSEKKFIENIYKLNNCDLYEKIKINGINLVNNEYSIEAISKKIINVID